MPCSESPGFTSITSAYPWSQLHNRWVKFIPQFALSISHISLWNWELEGELFLVHTWFQFSLFLFLFFFCPWTCFHGSVWVPDDPDLKSLFSCCHGSTLTSFKMWGKLHCSKLEKTAPSISARSGVTAKVLINFTSSVASATNTNCCEIFSSRVMEGGKRLAVSLRIIIRINPFTHLSLGTREGPKTCQAITQLHRSVHKIFHLTLAVICTH